MANSAEEIAQKVYDHIFGAFLQPTNGLQFFKNNIDNFYTPHKVKSALTGKTLYTSLLTNNRYISQEESREQAAKHDWIYKKRDIKSLSDLQSMLSNFEFIQTDRVNSSVNVERSDDIVQCQNIFDSVNFINSENIAHCNWGWASEYLVGCTRSGDSTLCAGMTEGVMSSGCFQVYASYKVTNSMYIKNCYDMYECMWCAHLSGKKYCIANMQFSKEEYFKLKQKILNWLFPELAKA